MPEFFERLNYSFGNEDWRTEQQALKIEKSDTVLCITASGDRPFHLLLDDCQKLISVDANPIQNYLLQLKAAAMKELKFEDYIRFLGAAPGKNREVHLKQISSYMDSEAANFWLENKKMVSKGILYQGLIERLTKAASICLRLARPYKNKRLFEINDLEEQRKFLKEHWDSKFWRKVFDIALCPFFAKKFLKDPGLYDHIDQSISVGRYIYNRMLNSLDQCLARENIIFSLLFQGYVHQDGFPPYLTEDGAKVIRDRLNRMSIKTANVIDYMEASPEGSFDCYSLSDIASYMDATSFERMMHAIYKTAKPGARFCIREFTSNHPFPKSLDSFFIRNTEKEKELEQKDQCFVYRYKVGMIKK